MFHVVRVTTGLRIRCGDVRQHRQQRDGGADRRAPGARSRSIPASPRRSDVTHARCRGRPVRPTAQNQVPTGNPVLRVGAGDPGEPDADAGAAPPPGPGGQRGRHLRIDRPPVGEQLRRPRRPGPCLRSVAYTTSPPRTTALDPGTSVSTAASRPPVSDSAVATVSPRAVERGDQPGQVGDGHADQLGQRRRIRSSGGDRSARGRRSACRGRSACPAGRGPASTRARPARRSRCRSRRSASPPGPWRRLRPSTALSGSGRMYRPMAMICTNVLALPPGLAAITPYRITAKRSSVMPISRTRMTRVTHQARSPSMDSPISADPVSALSAIGSAILPKSVTWPRLRAMWPSYRSVIAAMREDRPGDPPPGGVVAALGEQGQQEHRNQDQPEHGQRVGQIHQRHRWRRPFGHRDSATDRLLPVDRGPEHVERRRRSGRCRRCRRPGSAPGRRAAASGRQVRTSTIMTLPSTSGAWCGAAAANTPVRVERRSSSSSASTSTSSSVPIRSSARCAVSSSTSEVTRSTRSAMTSSSSLSGRSRAPRCRPRPSSRRRRRRPSGRRSGTPPVRPGPPRSRRGIRR